MIQGALGINMESSNWRRERYNTKEKTGYDEQGMDKLLDSLEKALS